MSDYLVIYEQAEDGGWGAYLPDLPGVIATGDTQAEVSARITEAVAAYVEELRQQGDRLPDPLHEAGRVSV